MAEDELVGNLASENLLRFLDEKKVNTSIDATKFGLALAEAGAVFTEPLTT